MIYIDEFTVYFLILNPSAQNLYAKTKIRGIRI
jgi:hypothetical protein